MKDQTSDATIKIIALLLLMVGVLAGLSGLGSRRLAEQRQSQDVSPTGTVDNTSQDSSTNPNSSDSKSAQKQGAFKITGIPLKVLKLPPLNMPPVNSGSTAGGQQTVGVR